MGEWHSDPTHVKLHKNACSLQLIDRLDTNLDRNNSGLNCAPNGPWSIYHLPVANNLQPQLYLNVNRINEINTWSRIQKATVLVDTQA